MYLLCSFVILLFVFRMFGEEEYSLKKTTVRAAQKLEFKIEPLRYAVIKRQTLTLTVQKIRQVFGKIVTKVRNLIQFRPL